MSDHLPAEWTDEEEGPGFQFLKRGSQPVFVIRVPCACHERCSMVRDTVEMPLDEPDIHHLIGCLRELLNDESGVA
jgi:hypothetical protein